MRIRMCACRVELRSRIEAHLLLCTEDSDAAKLKYVQKKLKDEVIGMARLDMYVKRWGQVILSAAGKGAAAQAAAKEGHAPGWSTPHGCQHPHKPGNKGKERLD